MTFTLTQIWIFATACLWVWVAWSTLRREGFTFGAVATFAFGAVGFALLL